MSGKVRNSYSEGQKRRHERERQPVTIHLTWIEADRLRQYLGYLLHDGNMSKTWRRRLTRIYYAAAKATGHETG